MTQILFIYINVYITINAYIYYNLLLCYNTFSIIIISKINKYYSLIEYQTRCLMQLSLSIKITLLHAFFLLVYDSIVKLWCLAMLSFYFALCSCQSILCLLFFSLIASPTLAVLGQTQAVDTVSIGVACLSLVTLVRLPHEGTVLVE